MYGLTDNQREYAIQKINNQKTYLNNNYITVGNQSIPFIDFFKNAYINSNRYIAEVNARVYSLYQYAKNNDLHNVFITLTLPTEYHPKTTKNGKSKPNPNFINDEFHTPNAGAKMLTKMWHRLLRDRSLIKLQKEKRVYFRVTEPHKDGTPHLHISLFVPKENIENIVKAVKRMYPYPQSKVEINVNNPIAYLMKYILKTLDDLRYQDDKYTDLSLWYIVNRITRLYTSRTLISLDVYRTLGGRFSLLELSYMYKNNELSVYLDPDNNKILEILQKDDKFGFMPIYQKKNIKVSSDYKAFDHSRPILKSNVKNERIPVFIEDEEFYLQDGILHKKDKVFIPSRAGNYALYNYYNALDIEDTNLHHFGLVQNEMIQRGLLEDVPILSLNDFNTDFENYEYSYS